MAIPAYPVLELNVPLLSSTSGYTWDTVVKAFESKELGEETALMNARLAKILQHTDYDAVNKRVIPWLPATASDGADDGAAVQTQEA